MSWATAAQFLGGAGSFMSGLGALGSVFGGGGESKTNETIMRKQAADPFFYPVRSAKKHGLHPLWAIGNSPSVSLPVTIGQSNTGSAVGDGFMKMADGIDRVAGAGKAQELKRYNQDVAERNNEADLLLKHQQWLNMRREGDLIGEQIIASQAQRASQSQRSQPDKYIQVYNNFTKQLEWVPNPDIFEIPESIGGVMYGRATVEDSKTEVRKDFTSRLVD